MGEGALLRGEAYTARAASGTTVSTGLESDAVRRAGMMPAPALARSHASSVELERGLLAVINDPDSTKGLPERVQALRHFCSACGATKSEVAEALRSALFDQNSPSRLDDYSVHHLKTMRQSLYACDLVFGDQGITVQRIPLFAELNRRIESIESKALAQQVSSIKRAGWQAELRESPLTPTVGVEDFNREVFRTVFDVSDSLSANEKVKKLRTYAQEVGRGAELKEALRGAIDAAATRVVPTINDRGSAVRFLAQAYGYEDILNHGAPRTDRPANPLVIALNARIQEIDALASEQRLQQLPATATSNPSAVVHPGNGVVGRTPSTSGMKKVARAAAPDLRTPIDVETLSRLVHEIIIATDDPNQNGARRINAIRALEKKYSFDKADLKTAAAKAFQKAASEVKDFDSEKLTLLLPTIASYSALGEGVANPLRDTLRARKRELELEQIKHKKDAAAASRKPNH